MTLQIHNETNSIKLFTCLMVSKYSREDKRVILREHNRTWVVGNIIPALISSPKLAVRPQSNTICGLVPQTNVGCV